MFAQAYRHRRVLVTGHTGFKGAWLSLWLNRLQARVIGYALPPDQDAGVFTACRLEKNLHRSIYGDIRDLPRLRAVIRKEQPDMIFHLAAQSLVRRSYRQPLDTYETNVMGTAHVLEAMRACPRTRILVNVTSDKCYWNNEWVWGYRETDMLGGKDPYSSSKSCSEIVTQAYYESFLRESGRLAATARAGNVIGGGDFAEDRIIPDCIRALASKRKIVLRNPGSVRPWQHVFEPLSGYLWLGARLAREGDAFTGAWNFGPLVNRGVTVEEIVRHLIEVWGRGAYTVARSRQKQHEAKTLGLDCSKAQHSLRWQPVLSVEEAIRLTAAWYRWQTEDPSPARMRQLSLEQIADYEARARARRIAWAVR